MPPQLTGRLAVRNKIINSSTPWLPWIASGVVGVLDADDIIGKVATPVYVALIAAAATVTIVTQVTRRLAGVADRAQVAEAGLLSYRIAAEHCEAYHHAVDGQQTAITTAPLPALHLVSPVSVGRATVPQQLKAPRSVRLAAPRRIQPGA